MAGQEGVPDPAGEPAGGAPAPAAPAAPRPPGARRGARRGARPKRRFRPDVALPLGGALVALVVWGVLVWVAIGAGREARGGESGQWLWLVLAALGAVVCLFGALWLVTLALRRVGLLSSPEPSAPGAPRH